MKRDCHTQDIQEWLPAFLHQLLTAPEFQYAEGEFLTRLEHVCYYHLGGLRYPGKLLLSQFFEILANKFEITLVAQDIRLRIIHAPVYKITADVAIMAQDVNQVLGPVDEMLSEDETAGDPMSMLQDFEPYRMGKVLVSSPKWCRARYLMEAVVYQLESRRITTRGVVATTLQECLEKCRELKIRNLAMDPLGTHQSGISYHAFVGILHEALVQCAFRLDPLKELTIAAKDRQQSMALKKAFADVLHLKI